MATKKTRPKASVDANRYPVLAARLYDVARLEDAMEDGDMPGTAQ